jgi:hypothetical protein
MLIVHPIHLIQRGIRKNKIHWVLYYDISSIFVGIVYGLNTFKEVWTALKTRFFNQSQSHDPSLKIFFVL